MKKFVLLLLPLIFVFSCFSQPRLSDRELAGLKGQVQKVEFDRSFSETYDRDGNLIIREIDGGNCQIKDEFSPVSVSVRKMKRSINDFSNSGMCTLTHQDLPRENGLLVYLLSYNDSYTSYTNEKLNEWQRQESATIGSSLLWKKYQFFDARARLVEEVYIGKDLVARTTIYQYAGEDADPVSARVLINNRHSDTYQYKYEERDAHGNWTRRINDRIEPKDQGGSGEIKRTITYY